MAAPNSGRTAWEAAFQGNPSPKELGARLRALRYPVTKMQDPGTKVRVIRSSGPLVFIAEQLVKRLERTGYPARYQCGPDPKHIEINSQAENTPPFIEMVQTLARICEQEYRCRIKTRGTWISMIHVSPALMRELDPPF